MNDPSYHPLLARQLKRLLGGREPPDDWRPLLAVVDQSHRQADEDRRLLERSLDLSSQELLQANRDLRAILRLLPDMFYRVRADGTVLDCRCGPSDEREVHADCRGRHLSEIALPCRSDQMEDLLARAPYRGPRHARAGVPCQRPGALVRNQRRAARA